ncbi:gas vesicle protein GvpJ [Candidatus Nitrososphaera gargensis Ga9.2]|uniref:Gas vesicle protein GvpJ n=1 Tax=Nitrososphaera gargensis (strain Ga9.2) TaxID=1237085 RepID=K0IH03_NITGG|nr:gas vesicle protein [Candidatus Nitrososphaera gargensis]AFU59135.1 gas vesicle protein GvpJ [Candidatus Nitrososphaera gargensis Ga9.2]
MLSSNRHELPARQLSLFDLLDRILDKGVVINGDITVAFAGVDLLSLKVNLVIASLETAKRYGIELPWEKWAREKAELEKKEKKIVGGGGKKELGYQ